jgi:capsular polysaccharide transport system permease protein
MPFRPVAALVLREVATTHGRSFGGYGWAIVEPIAAVSLLSLVFSLFFKSPPLGNSFPLFYATGYLAFTLYNDVAQKTASSLRYSRPLLAYPVVNWFDAIVARFLLTVFTHLIVAFVVLLGILLVEEIRAQIDLIVLFLALMSAAVFGLAVGAVNIILFEFCPVWERIWSIINRPLFMLSGVLFLPTQIPEPYRDWLWYNPLVQIISSVRSGVYSSYDTDFTGTIYVSALTLTLMVTALVLLARHARGQILNS